MNRPLICALLLIAAVAAAEPPVVPLWPNGAPGSEAYAGQPEKYLEKDDHITRVYNIHNPSITVYLPHVNRATGVGVVVAPGGAHQYLAVGIEGEEIAHRLNAAGIAVFVLKYRLSRSEGSTYTIEAHSVQDAQRALRVVRSRAKEWQIDPGRVGVMGFSAGGALVGLTGTKFDAGNQAASDPVERLSSRPNFLVFGYTGGKVDPKTITKETPPAFLISAADDRGPTANNLALFSALTEAGVPAEIHVYNRGGHGFGFLGRSPEFLKWPVSHWPEQLLAWLADLGILKR